MTEPDVHRHIKGDLKMHQHENPSEQACGERFITWANAKNGTAYSLERAEVVFPELNGRTRWEFVAHQPGDPKWNAIEVKKLIIPILDREWKDWKKLCFLINKQVKGLANGVIYLLDPPTLKLTQQQRKDLLRIMADEIIATSVNMGMSNGIVDIGPQIAAKCKYWPRTKSISLKEYQQWGEFRPHPLLISKENAVGCEVKLMGASACDGGDITNLYAGVLDNIFKGSDVKANIQLGEAKNKGAWRTILLLDSPLLWQARPIKDYLSVFPSHLLSNIDFIYLVGTDNVEKLYGDELNEV